MSADASLLTVEAQREAALRRAALRLAVGVTVSFTIAEGLDWDFTFFGPMLAAQLLVKLPRPLSLGQGLGLLLLIAAATGVLLLITTALIGTPSVLLLALGLLLYFSWYAQFRGAPELLTLFLQLAAVTVPVFEVISVDRATGFSATFFKAGVVALAAVWGAFALFPPVEGPAPPSPPRAVLSPREAAVAAMRNAVVLMPILIWYVLDARQVAVVVLVTIVTLLRQYDPRQSEAVAAALVVGNLIGGVAAAVAYDLVKIGDHLIFFVLICLFASLMFSGRIVLGGRSAPVLAVGFSTFILLLGLGLSPVPGTSGEAFLTRLGQVLLAALYAIGALALLHRPPRAVS